MEIAISIILYLLLQAKKMISTCTWPVLFNQQVELFWELQILLAGILKRLCGNQVRIATLENIYIISLLVGKGIENSNDLVTTLLINGSILYIGGMFSLPSFSSNVTSQNIALWELNSHEFLDYSGVQLSSQVN